GLGRDLQREPGARAALLARLAPRAQRATHEQGRVSTDRHLPLHGWIGLALSAGAWLANGLLDGLRTHVLFFPLWLGYVLFLDGCIARRDGSSPGTRAPRAFAALFALSVPLWWLFE